MSKCSDCSKKVRIKSATSLFGIDDKKLTVSAKSHAINIELIAELQKRHKAKRDFMVSLAGIFGKMFTIEMANLNQVVPEVEKFDHGNTNDIFKIETKKHMMISNSPHVVQYHHSASNCISINMTYVNNQFSIDGYIRRKNNYDYPWDAKDKHFFEKVIVSKNDLYDFISKLNETMMQMNYRFSPNYDFTSTELDELFTTFDIWNVKPHSMLAVNKLFTGGDINSSEFIDFYLTSNAETQKCLQERLYSLF
jgi:hypothetical protein